MVAAAVILLQRHEQAHAELLASFWKRIISGRLPVLLIMQSHGGFGPHNSSRKRETSRDGLARGRLRVIHSVGLAVARGART